MVRPLVNSVCVPVSTDVLGGVWALRLLSSLSPTTHTPPPSMTIFDGFTMFSSCQSTTRGAAGVGSSRGGTRGPARLGSGDTGSGRQVQWVTWVTRQSVSVYVREGIGGGGSRGSQATDTPPTRSLRPHTRLSGVGSYVPRLRCRRSDEGPPDPVSGPTTQRVVVPAVLPPTRDLPVCPLQIWGPEEYWGFGRRPFVLGVVEIVK